MTPEGMAQKFHETYERLAPTYGYKTRVESAVPWDQVPVANRNLMVAVCAEILETDVQEALALYDQKILSAEEVRQMKLFEDGK